ncbi:sialate O-acetylesterase [Flavihumibacter profundi]|uniref:sialate O-acetylesterase n=1 Tax=Flavihumibacter profundi TaxID=2716883 RepID=UPI001CC3C5CD|nr:sialate O-acetylesterase [Flavihumibacter profundi]MBZ5859285.1 sialate O-acetylesterase [Flavihumibacter profundi]
MKRYSVFSGYFFFATLFLFSTLQSLAQLRLPAIISSGMVLQQNESVNIWGWAGPAEKIYVTTSWNNHTDSAVAGNMAVWKLMVNTPKAGGPYTVTIKGRTTITLSDVMIGEVWICSGQSNMEWSYNNGTSDIATDFPTAYNKKIRFFQVPKTGAVYPQDDVKANWAICDSNTLKSFSSVGYFFGKKLSNDLDVPIGLINASWGGTAAEPWTPEEVVNHDPMLKGAASKLQSVPWWPNGPGQTFNGMIYPLTNYNIAGAIWYQGESNTSTNATYQQLFTKMIESWRKAFKKEIPFYYVQIAPYAYGQKNVGALLQEQQALSMTYPKTGMVVITDLVDSVTNIHPSRKRPVGERLANWALSETYGVSGIAYKSPELISAALSNDKIILRFTNAPNGLIINGNEATGFFVSGEQEAWFPAKAKVEKDVITVTCPEVKTPYHVRYGFGNTTIGNVSSLEGLPVVPFRTDDWKVDQSPVN